MKKNKRVMVDTDLLWLPENAVKFMQFWVDILTKIPEEFRDSANIEFEAYDDYGSPNFDFSVHYYRPETAREEANRLENDKDHSDATKQAELEQLRKLQEKYKDE